jgi:hypothetical protein
VKALKSLLALNGLVFLLRGGLNLTRPTSFYLAKGAPDNAIDAVRVLGITYVAFGLVQTGVWFTPERTAVRVVAGSSMLFASGVALQALNQDAALPDSFHQGAAGHMGGWFPPVLTTIPWSPRVRPLQNESKMPVVFDDDFGKAVRSLIEAFYPSLAGRAAGTVKGAARKAFSLLGLKVKMK